MPPRAPNTARNVPAIPRESAYSANNAATTTTAGAPAKDNGGDVAPLFPLMSASRGGSAKPPPSVIASQPEPQPTTGVLSGFVDQTGAADAPPAEHADSGSLAALPKTLLGGSEPHTPMSAASGHTDTLAPPPQNRGHEGPSRKSSATSQKSSTATGPLAPSGAPPSHHPFFTRAAKESRTPKQPAFGFTPPSTALLDGDWASTSPHRTPQEAALAAPTPPGGQRTLVNALRHATSVLMLRSSFNAEEFTDEERDEMLQLYRVLGKYQPANVRRRSVSGAAKSHEGTPTPPPQSASAAVAAAVAGDPDIEAALSSTKGPAEQQPPAPLGLASVLGSDEPSGGQSRRGMDFVQEADTPASQAPAQPHPVPSPPRTGRPAATGGHTGGATARQLALVSAHHSTELMQAHGNREHAGVSWRAAALLNALSDRVAALPPRLALPEIESVTERFVAPCRVRIATVDAAKAVVFQPLPATVQDANVTSPGVHADAASAAANHKAVACAEHVAMPLISHGKSVGALVCIAPQGSTIDVVDAAEDSDDVGEHLHTHHERPAVCAINSSILAVAVAFTAHALAVGNAVEMSTQRSRTLAAITDLARGGRPSTDALLQQLRDLIEAESVVLLDAQQGALLLPDADGGDPIAAGKATRLPIADPSDIPRPEYQDHHDTRVWPGAVAVLAAAAGSKVHLKNAAEATRANAVFDRQRHVTSRECIAVPIRRGTTVVAVLQVTNKEPMATSQSVHGQNFSEADVEAIEAFAQFLGSSNTSSAAESRAAEASQRARRLHSAIRSMRGFTPPPAAEGDTTAPSTYQLAAAVTAGARSLLPMASSVSLFLIGGAAVEPGPNADLPELLRWEVDGRFTRMERNTGIAARTARLGRTHCVDLRTPGGGDVVPAVDVPLGIVNPVSVLSVPLFATDGRAAADAAPATPGGSTRRGPVTAVLQLVSCHHPTASTAGGYASDESGDAAHVFTPGDALSLEAFAEAAALYIGPAVSAANAPMALSVAAFEPAVQRVRAIPATHPLLANLTSRDFDIRPLMALEPLGYAFDLVSRAAVTLIMATGLPQKHNCTEDTLIRYVLACRARYTDTTYHNWFHAFDVCQTLHTFLYECNLAEMLNPEECYGLLVASLAHDVDHTGMNNPFHARTKTPLGVFADAAGGHSVLEFHHADVMASILSRPGFDVFAGTKDDDERVRAISVGMSAILATDAAKHGEVFEHLKQTKFYDIDNVVHRTSLAKAVLHAADVSNPSKPWPICEMWAVRVVEEFSRQGDVEKAMGFDVSPMFDRDYNTDIARGQVGFIGFMVESFYASLAGLAEGFVPVLERAQANKAQWQSKVPLTPKSITES